MKYKIEKLGENLYKVVMPWWSDSDRRLVPALLEIQGSGKIVTHVRKLVPSWSETYVVCTSDKS